MKGGDHRYGRSDNIKGLLLFSNCLKNGKIYTMKDEVIENGSILIKDGKIVEVGDNIIAHLDTR